MKIKRIKKLKVNSYLFDVVWEGMSGYGHISYTDHKIIIGIKNSPDSEIFETIDRCLFLFHIWLHFL